MVIRPLRPTRHDKGYVLVWVIFCFMLLYLIAMSLANSSLLEESISFNYRQAAQAYEMADGGVLVGVEEVYDILKRDHGNSQDIPNELILSKQEWILNESGREMGFYLENPKCSGVESGKCRFQFISKGVSPPAQRILAAEVEVEFLDIYKIEFDIDGGAVTVFDHREYIYPAKIISIEYKCE